MITARKTHVIKSSPTPPSPRLTHSQPTHDTDADAIAHVSFPTSTMMQGRLLHVLLLLLLPACPHAFVSPASLPVPPSRSRQLASTSAVATTPSTTTSSSAEPRPLQRLQTLDYTTLALVAQEMKEQLIPGRVENVIQQDDFSLLLQMRCVDAFTWLLICWQPEAARVCLQKDGPSGSGGGGGSDKKKKRGGRGGGGGGGGGGLSGSALYSLPGQLKGFLQLKTLINVVLPLPGERILVFEFADRLTDTIPTHKLVVEIMGRRSNVMLVDGKDDSVLACGYQVSPSKSVRSVSVGQRYTLPPPLTAPMPPPLPEDPAALEAYETEFLRRVTLVPSHPLPKALISAYRGFSPQLVETMAAAVGIADAGTTPVGELAPEALARLVRGPLNQWVRVLVLRDAQALADNKGGLSADGTRYTPILFESQGGWRSVPSVLALVEGYYTAYLERQELRDLQRKGLSRVQSVLQRLQRTRQEFQRQLDAAAEEQVAKLQIKAEMLTTYAYSWKEGDAECVCADFETGAEVRIPLKPGNTAADDAQAAYCRIRKLKRSVDAVLPLLQKIDLKVAYVEELESSIQQLGDEGVVGAGTASGSATSIRSRTLTQDLAVMREIAEELGIDGPGGSGGGTTTFFSTILNRLSLPGGEGQQEKGGNKKGGNKKQKGGNKSGGGKGGKAKGKRGGGGGSAPASMAIQSFRPPASSDESPSPLRIYVGRNSKQNDYVTFTLARDHELWFHAQGVPGAHCLMRCDPGVEVSDADMQFAADLAAYFSKARGAGQVPVLWTSPKNLKRVVGGGPGMVQVSKEKVLWGRPSQGEQIVRKQKDDDNDDS